MPLLPETAQRVNEIVALAQARGRVPALAAVVVRGGQSVHFTGAGDFPHPEPNTQFRIGSITKTMTAAVVFALRDEGMLALDDPLRRHLPDTPFGDLTLRQLLGHVSGLQREPDGEWWERSAGMPVDRFLASLAADKITYPAHRGYHYSNLAYGLLGAVLTRLTGEPWADLITGRILGPLGMTRTTYHATEPFARGYVVHPWHGTLREEPRHDAGAMAPAGQLWSTPNDLARWAAFLADPQATSQADRRPPVLDPATVREMCAPAVISDLRSWTAGYGLGVQLWRRGERVFVGHTGSMPGYLAILAVHRPTRTGVVAFANAYTVYGGGIGDVGREVLTAVLDRESSRPTAWRPGALPPAEAEPLTGRWWWMGQEFQVAWDARSRELVVIPVSEPGGASRFTADGPDRWRGRSGPNDGEVLRVRRGRTGAVTALDIATFVFTRDPWPAM
jgi:CubicO group peptidase (beta-lactamase class C family)